MPFTQTPTEQGLFALHSVPTFAETLHAVSDDGFDVSWHLIK